MKKVLMGIVLLNLFCVNGNVLDQIPRFETREEAMYWVHDNIEYSSDHDYKVWNNIEYWQSPDQTLNMRSGDCEDLSILLLSILNSQFGDTPNIGIIHIKGAKFDHVIIKSNGILYNSSGISMDYEYDYLYDIDYDTAVFLAESHLHY